jgi:sugar lactone lactonase YvrE
MRTKLLAFYTFLALFVAVSCEDKETEPVLDPLQFQATNFASGLRAPIGLAIDEKGQLWVSESGTGNNDASISMITKTATVHEVIAGFNSAVTDGAVEGMGHILYKEGKLYILNGNTGRLYIADVSGYKPGDPKLDLHSLASEDIGTFVRSLNLPTGDHTNIYHLTFGPEGHLYIADAASNSIIKRDKDSKALSLFARIPNVTPTSESVPTGIVYDGTKFLVSAFTGFPFSTGSAKIFQVDKAGNVSDYKSNFTTLTDIVLTPNNKPLVLEFSEFSLTTTPPGFVPLSGRVANEDGTTLLSGLMMPTDIERSGDKTYYVLSYALGTVQRLTY